MDNSGRWSSLYYHPVFASGAKGSQYKANCLPAGCHPVPPNEDGAVIRTHGEWNCFYQGWNKEGEKDGMREKISDEGPPPWVYVKYNIFPRSRKR